MQAAAKESPPVASDGAVNPFALSSSDYNGTWDTGLGTTLDLFVKGDNPEKGKVKGTFTSPVLAGGTAKFKGKVTNGDELNGKFRGKVIHALQTQKTKAIVSVQLTDSTHFAGTLEVFPKGSPPTTGLFGGTKI